MKEWEDIKKCQEKIRTKYEIYKNWKLPQIMKKDEEFRTAVLDICEWFDNSTFKPNITRDLYIATLENLTLEYFMIHYDYEMELLGEEYLIAIGVASE